MIQSQKIVLHNFGSWRKGELDLRDRGLVLLQGPIGVGKSTVVRAIPWALDGNTPEKMKSGEVVRGLGKRATSVTYHFQKGNHTYAITRYRQHKEFGNKVILTRDGSAWNESDSLVKSVDVQIRNLMGADPMLFLRTWYFAQRDLQNRFPALTDLQQKKLLEECTELRVFPRAEEITRKRLKHAKLAALLTDTRLTTLKETLQDNHRKIRAEQKRLDTQAKEAKKERQADAKLIAELKRKIEKWQAIITRLEQAHAVLHTDLSHVLAERTSIVNNITRMKRLKGNRCPLCGAKVSRAHVTAELTRLEAALVRTEKSRVRLHNQFDTVTLQRTQHKLNADRELLVSVSAVAQRAPTAIVSLLPGLTKDRRTLTQRIKQTKAKCDRKKLLTMQLSFWMKGWKELRAATLTAILAEIQKRTNYYLFTLLPDKHVEVSYGLSDSGRIEQQYKLGKRWRSYASLSGGQKQCADLCGSLAVRDIAEASLTTFSDLLVLDEPFEGLSTKVIERVPALLRKLRKRTVLVISHSEKLRPYFETVIDVEMQNGVSQWAA
jgi:DNA repair exonuclease SbcCD ATPase subunit